MTESRELVAAKDQSSFFRWPRVIGLALLLVLVLWFVGKTASMCIAEVGVYLWDDDLVQGGRYLASVREFESVNRMKSFGLSVEMHNDTMLHLPTNGVNTYGQLKVEHSWLTWTLPFSWQGGAFGKIDTSKSWNDPANFDAFHRRIKDYEIPNRNLPRFDERGYALAHIAGNEALLGVEKPTLAKIPDGAANTVLAATASGNFEPWGKPGHLRDLTRGINRSPGGFGSPWSTGGATTVFADGSVRTLSNDTSPEILRAIATPAGGEPHHEF